VAFRLLILRTVNKAIVAKQGTDTVMTKESLEECMLEMLPKF
jgi:hypothetical protein